LAFDAATLDVRGITLEEFEALDCGFEREFDSVPLDDAEEPRDAGLGD